MQENYKHNNWFIIKTSGFYIIVLHVSAIMATIRQNLYKNAQRKVNIDDKRDLSLVSFY
jgi:hypothetical protein